MASTNTLNAELPLPATSVLLQTASDRRKRLADLKTQILGDPTHMYDPIPGESIGDGGEIAANERALVVEYLNLTSLPTLETLSQKIIDRVTEELRVRANSTKSDLADLNELAPKKANADLKRDLDKMTAPLEKQTELIMFELLRERLASQQPSGNNLAAAVHMASSSAHNSPSPLPNFSSEWDHA